MTCHPLYQFAAAGDRGTAAERYLGGSGGGGGGGGGGGHIGLSNIGLNNPGGVQA